MKEFLTLSRIEQHAFPGAQVNYDEPPTIVRTDVLWMTAGDGDWIAGLFAPGAEDNDLCVIHFYGNGENLRTSEFIIDSLRDLGVSVLLFDYRGYGASQGRPSESNFYTDAEFAFDWLQEHYPNLRPVAAGWSLGSAVATHLATTRPVHGLVLFSPVTDMVKMVRHIFPPDEIIIEEAFPFRFDALSKIGKVKCPIFMAHGKRDNIVPFSMSDDLHRAAHTPVERFDIDSATHNDLFAVGGPGLWQRVGEFLKTLK